MHGNGVLNLVDQLNPGYEYWAPCQEMKQVSGGDDGPGLEPIPLSSKLWCFFLFALIIIMSFDLDGGVVINDYHRHLRGEGGRVFTTVM